MLFYLKICIILRQHILDINIVKAVEQNNDHFVMLPSNATHFL